MHAILEKCTQTNEIRSGTSGMLWTAMAKAMTGPILVKDEKATCTQTAAISDVYQLVPSKKQASLAA